MKAIIYTKYGSPEVLQINEVTKPVPKDNEVLIKVCATTVTVADTRVRSFTVPLSFWIPARFYLGLRKPKRQILGVELSGQIEAIGKNVRLFKKGDRIFGSSVKEFGTYAEYKCLPENGFIAKMPENISYEEAATIPVGARTALHYLRKSGIKPGQKILIYGASGSVGTYAVQLARHFGAEVTGVCSSANLNLVKSIGANKLIDYTAKDFEKKIGFYDIIFVAIDKLSFSICNESLKREGVYLNVTSPIKSLQMWWTSITTRKRIIMGENASDSPEDLIFLKSLVETGVLKPVIDRCYTFDQIVVAHHYVDKGHKKGNVAVTVNPA